MGHRFQGLFQFDRPAFRLCIGAVNFAPKPLLTFNVCAFYRQFHLLISAFAGLLSQRAGAQPLTLIFSASDKQIKHCWSYLTANNTML